MSCHECVSEVLSQITDNVWTTETIAMIHMNQEFLQMQKYMPGGDKGDVIMTGDTVGQESYASGSVGAFYESFSLNKYDSDVRGNV